MTGPPGARGSRVGEGFGGLGVDWSGVTPPGANTRVHGKNGTIASFGAVGVLSPCGRALGAACHRRTEAIRRCRLRRALGRRIIEGLNQQGRRPTMQETVSFAQRIQNFVRRKVFDGVFAIPASVDSQALDSSRPCDPCPGKHPDPDSGPERALLLGLSA